MEAGVGINPKKPIMWDADLSIDPEKFKLSAFSGSKSELEESIFERELESIEIRALYRIWRYDGALKKIDLIN